MGEGRGIFGEWWNRKRGRKKKGERLMLGIGEKGMGKGNRLTNGK